MLRPDLQALMADALAGRFTVLIAEALDRLSHDQADVAAIYKRLSFAGVRILTLSEGWIEELHVGLKGTMNQLYLKELAAKTRLMQPDAVAAFVKDFADLSNAQNADRAQERQRLEAEQKTLKRKLEGLYDAIAEGLRSPPRAQGEAPGSGGPRGCYWRRGRAPCPIARATEPEPVGALPTQCD